MPSAPEATYYIQGLFRQGNAALARRYLGIPEPDGDPDHFLNGEGEWVTPPGGTASPGAPDNSSQYRVNGTTFGGVPLNATATPMFLQQVSSGIPSMQQVEDSDLLMNPGSSTNDSQVGTHGFLKELDGNESNFMDGTGNWSNPTGGMAIGWFRYDNNTVIADPGAGDFRMNTLSWGTATVLAFDQFSDPGNDVTAMIMALRTNDQILIQKKNDATVFGRFTVTATPTNQTGWFSIPVSNVVDSGFMPSNTQLCAVVVSYDGGGGGGGITELTTDVVAGPGSGTQVATIQPNAVTDTKLRDSAAVSVIGRSANSSGDPADIAAAANDRVLARTGDTLAFQQLTVGMAPNDVWTYAKLQNVSAAERLLGRGEGGGSGDVEEITLGANLFMIGTALHADASDATFWREAIFIHNGLTINALGAGVNQDAVAVAAVLSTSTQCAGARYTTSTVSGNQRKLTDAVAGDAVNLFRPGTYFLILTLENTTECRFYAGLMDGTGVWGSDTAAVEYVGFRYSTAAGDTNWQAVCDDNSGTPTVADTGVAPGTCQRLRLSWLDENDVFFYINDVLVATLSAANLPTASMAWGAGVTNLTTVAAAKSWVHSTQKLRTR